MASVTGHKTITVVAVPQGKCIMCLFATQLNILCCVCVAHAQDLHWLLTTGRRIWQKSVSSVRRICSILFSMPVTPSAEVHPHKHTHVYAVFNDWVMHFSLLAF